MVRVLVYVISPVAINKLIGFNKFPQVIQVWSCVDKCRPKGHKGALVEPPTIIFLSDLKFFLKTSLFCCLCFDFLLLLWIKESDQGAQSTIEYIARFIVFNLKNVDDIFMFVEFLFNSLPIGTKDHWVNPLQNFNQNHVYVFEKRSMYKNSCCKIFRQMDTKDHLHNFF